VTRLQSQPKGFVTLENIGGGASCMICGLREKFEMEVRTPSQG
jgi:hypothetical protein